MSTPTRDEIAAVIDPGGWVDEQLALRKADAILALFPRQQYEPNWFPINTTSEPYKGRYTNWRGETAYRTIRPIYIYYGSNKWHPEPQWLIDAVDVETGKLRSFALSGFGQQPG